MHVSFLRLEFRARNEEEEAIPLLRGCISCWEDLFADSVRRMVTEITKAP